MFDLKGKVAVITGGAKGVGGATVRSLLDEGAKFVAIVDFDETSGILLEKDLIQQYGKHALKFFHCDITRDEDFFDVFDYTVKNHGYIDVVLNVAAICNDVEYKKEVDINFTGVVTSTLKALEMMRKDKGGAGGTVINISSIAALAIQKVPTFFVYAATKSAVLMFSATVGMEAYYSHTGVRVITMCFGLTATSMIQSLRCIDDITTASLNNVVEENKSQMPEAAAAGIVEAFKNGKSGSVWTVIEGETLDVTDRVSKGYQIISGEIQ